MAVAVPAMVLYFFARMPPSNHTGPSRNIRTRILIKVLCRPCQHSRAPQDRGWLSVSALAEIMHHLRISTDFRIIDNPGAVNADFHAKIFFPDLTLSGQEI